MEEQSERGAASPLPLAETISSTVAESPLELLEEAEAPAPKKRKKKVVPILVPEEYIVRAMDGSELIATPDIFDALEVLKKQTAGAELVRRSDGAKLSYTTRQQAPRNLVPTAPISYKRR